MYVFVSRRNFDPHGDAFFYHAGANLLADGKGFISPFFVQLGLHRAAAEHPPLYIIFLAIPSVLGMKSVLTHLLWSCVLGVGARWGWSGCSDARSAVRGSASSPRSIAAVYPNLWAPDGMLQAETLSMFAAAATLLLAYRYWQQPSGRRLALVGAGVRRWARMARSELILLVPLARRAARVVDARAHRGEQRLRWLGASVLARR